MAIGLLEVILESEDFETPPGSGARSLVSVSVVEGGLSRGPMVGATVSGGRWPKEELGLSPSGGDVALGLSEGSCATSSVSVVGGTSSVLVVEGGSSESFGNCTAASPLAIGDTSSVLMVEGGSSKS